MGVGHGASAAMDPGPGNPKKGAALIRKNGCASCHATGPKGDSPNAKAPAFRTLIERYPLENLEEAFAEGISVGHEGLEMPEFEFTPAQIDDLLAYLRGLSKP
jgi:mono/diheme cytochrome c family protein